jgi:PAS domain S-box-containing protein
MNPAQNRLFGPPRDEASVPSLQQRNGSADFDMEQTAARTKANILLVDDRADKLLALQAVLGHLDENIVVARSGKEALRHLLQTEFAVILLDVSMPGMDGFETAALIRKRPATEHTPIIFVTSLNQTENSITRGYQLGAVDYIITPIIPEVIRSKVSVFVELFKRTEQIKQQSERLRQLEEQAFTRRLNEAVDKLEAETKRNRFFTLALDMLGIGTFDGRLLQVNPAWERVLGYTEEELKSTHSFDFLHPDDRALAQEMAGKLIQGLPTGYFEVRARHKDGSYRWIGWTAAAFEAERLVYIFGRDVTQRKTNEQEIELLNAQLNKRVQQLTDTNKELEAFCYSISHDLRAPLRAMHGFSQALIADHAEKLDEEGRHYVDRIAHSAKYMDSMLRDLLEYSRLTLCELPVARLDLDHELKEVLRNLEQDISAKNATIDIALDARHALAHPATFRQVFWNLVTNALKFVPPERKPEVRIRSETNGTHVRISVMDNGIGIPPEHCERVFNLFERLHRDPAFPGTGVGLAVVRRAIERMGGRVGVESTVGTGSRFWLELPVTNHEETLGAAG